MLRPPQLQYPGAIYHLVPRGDGRRTLFHDDGLSSRFTQRLSDEVSRSGLLLDAKSRSCADQNARAKFVPWYAALAFGICELVRQTKSTDFCNVARIVRSIWIESSRQRLRLDTARCQANRTIKRSGSPAKGH